jgi:hypothetical protein
VVTDEGRTRDLAEINLGDIVMLEHSNGQATEIRVVRRVFEEYSSPSGSPRLTARRLCGRDVLQRSLIRKRRNT